MPVQLQSDLIVSPFWQRMRDALTAQMMTDEWTIVLRPKTRADEELTDDPRKYNLTRRQAKALESGSPTIEANNDKRVVTFSIPNPPMWEEADVDDLADEWLDMAGLLTEEE